MALCLEGDEGREHKKHKGRDAKSTNPSVFSLRLLRWFCAFCVPKVLIQCHCAIVVLADPESAANPAAQEAGDVSERRAAARNLTAILRRLFRSPCGRPGARMGWWPAESPR